MTSDMAKEIVVIGGGAAGLMAAITAARQGAAVTLLEPNERLGKKVNITGCLPAFPVMGDFCTVR